MNVLRIVPAICLVLVPIFGVGCTAVCVRDSDCLGESICSENRCILIVRSDAGRAPVTPSSGDGTPITPPTTPPEDASGDAGTSPSE